MAKSAQGVKASEFGMAQKAAHATIRELKTERERYRAQMTILKTQLLQAIEEGDLAFIKAGVQAFDIAAGEATIFD